MLFDLHKTVIKQTETMKKIILMALLLVAATFVFAQKPAIVSSDKAGWHKIGEVSASFETESEGISVLGKDAFKSIKLKVTDAPLTIKRVVVFYESGESQEIPVDGTLSAGSETGEFGLKWPDNEIKKVTFTYRSEPSHQGKKAHVELYGRK